MSAKPSYLGLLNAIAVGEGRGHALFAAWSAATDNEELRSTLDVVAIRECEHSAAFTKRICELGYSVRESDDSGLKERLALAESDLSDRKKFRKLLGIGKKSDTQDKFPELFKDASIDPTTGALLGRFIAEERDSGRLLRCAYDSLKSSAAADQPTRDPVLTEIAQRIEKLSGTLEELKAIRSA